MLKGQELDSLHVRERSPAPGLSKFAPASRLISSRKTRNPNADPIGTKFGFLKYGGTVGT